MAPDRLPLSVLVALGLASCGPCRLGVCLSPIPRDQEGDEQLRPCLSVAPPQEEPPDAPPDVCLSIAPPPEPEPPIPEPEPPIPEAIDPEAEPTQPETLPDDPPRPCLSVRWEPPPRPPDEPDPETLPVCLSEDMDPEGEDDGASALEPTPGAERVAVLERLGDALPADVRERL